MRWIQTDINQDKPVYNMYMNNADFSFSLSLSVYIYIYMAVSISKPYPTWGIWVPRTPQMMGPYLAQAQVGRGYPKIEGHAGISNI